MSCKDCWKRRNPGGEDFEKEAKASWRRRSTNQRQLMRIQTFQDVVSKQIRELGESSRMYRKRCMNSAASIATIFMKSFMRGTAAQQAQVVSAMQEMMDDRSKIVADPTFQPLLVGDAHILPALVAQYLSDITPMMSEYFLCRQKDPQCGWFSISANWAYNYGSGNEGGGQFRCPSCGAQYRPWLQRASLLECNKLMVLQNDDVPIVLPDNTVIDKNQTVMLPIWWCDTPAEKMQHRVKEIFGQIHAEMRDMSVGDMMREIKTIAERAGAAKTYFQVHHMPAAARKVIDENNKVSRKAACGQPYVYEHLLKPEGYIGAHFQWTPDMVALDQDTMARLWAYCRLAVHAAAARPRL